MLTNLNFYTSYVVFVNLFCPFRPSVPDSSLLMSEYFLHNKYLWMTLTYSVHVFLFTIFIIIPAKSTSANEQKTLRNAVRSSTNFTWCIWMGIYRNLHYFGSFFSQLSLFCSHDSSCMPESVCCLFSVAVPLYLFKCLGFFFHIPIPLDSIIVNIKPIYTNWQQVY